MEDKKILVFYVGIGDMKNEHIEEYMGKVKNIFFSAEFIAKVNAEVMLLPIRDVNSRVECINPKYISDKDLIAKHEELMKDYLESLNNFIDEQKENGK